MNERDDKGPEATDMTAAEWLVRLRDESADETTDAAFKAWLASNPAHELDLERCEMANDSS